MMPLYLFVLLAALLPAPQTAPAAPPTLDYEFFKARVQPIFLAKRKGLARCYVCHSQGTPFRLQPLPPGATSWNEEDSRKNFEAASRLVNAANPSTTPLLRMPLAAEAGGIAFHPGGKHWTSTDDPEWRTIAAWVRGETAERQERSATLIRNAIVLDGTGAAGRHADVRISGDRIIEVGHPTPSPSDRIVDARGLTLAPGFIDTHSHASRGLFDHPDALADVSQGITTVVVGQDGSSTYPLAEYFDRLHAAPAAVNVASYIGHGTLRHEVMGSDFKRTATEDEIRRMQDLVASEMRAGALGLSTGLEYDPGIYSAPAEVVALSKTAAASGGRYISHIRSEDREEWQAIDEVIAIGREARMPVQISHVKLAMRSLWGQAGKLIQILDRARGQHVDVTADIYPYTYWQSTITVLFPKRDFANRNEARFILDQVVAPDDLLIAHFDANPSYAGKTLAQIAALRHTPPDATLVDVIKEGEAHGTSAGVIATSMDERDVAALLQWPFANICTDGELDGAHPRGFGSFPRVLGRYVRDQHVLTLEEAVRKMTTLAAANVGLIDRGVVAPGRYADLVLFDPATVADRATTADPHAVSTGIRTVWVNGEIVFQDGAPTNSRSGRVLRRGDK